MEFELLYDVKRIVLYHIEIAVITVTRYKISVFPVPLGMLHTDILCGNHLTIEQYILGSVQFVILLDQPENTLHKLQIFGIIRYFKPHKLRSLHKSVNSYGQILASYIDISGVKQRQHAILLQILEIFIVSHLYLMHQVYDITQERLIIHFVIYGILYAAVQVDCKHTLRTCRDTARTKRIAETVVLYLVSETTTRTERIGIVTHICKERMSLGIHLGSKVAPFLVYHISILCKKSHCLDRECKHSLRSLLVKPFHETLLKPAQSVPVRLASIRKIELSEKAFKIRAVVISNVPEHRLVITCSRRLVYRIYNLLETVGYHLVYRPVFQRHINHLVCFFPILLSVLHTKKVVQVHQEFRCRACTAQHA